MILDLLDRPISIPRVFAILLEGDYTSAALLTQIVYWSKRTKNKDGWFYKSGDEWWDEIGIKPSDLKKSCRKLEELKLISKKRMGTHGVMHYQLNGTNLEKFIDGEGLALSAHALLDRYRFRLHKMGQAAQATAYRLSDGKSKYFDLVTEIKKRINGEYILCDCCGQPITRGPSLAPKTASELPFDGLSIGYRQSLQDGGEHTPENMMIAHRGCVANYVSITEDDLLPTESQGESTSSTILIGEEKPFNNQVLVRNRKTGNSQDCPTIQGEKQENPFNFKCLSETEKDHQQKPTNTYTQITTRERDTCADEIVEQSFSLDDAPTVNDALAGKLGDVLTTNYSQINQLTAFGSGHVAPLASTTENLPTMRDICPDLPPAPIKAAEPSQAIAIVKLLRLSGIFCGPKDQYVQLIMESGIDMKLLREVISSCQAATGRGGFGPKYLMTAVEREVAKRKGIDELKLTNKTVTRSSDKGRAAKPASAAATPGSEMEWVEDDLIGGHYVFRR